MTIPDRPGYNPGEETMQQGPAKEIPVFTEDPKEYQFRLATNPTVNALAQRLSSAHLDWDTIFARAHELDISKIDPSNTPGLLGEMHVNSVLAAAKEEFGDAIDLDPIGESDQSTSFHFKKDREGSVVAHRKSDAHQVAEYDAFILVNGLPVLIEVKLSDIASSKGKRNFRDALQPAEVNRKLGPLHEYCKERFGTSEFGYIVIGTEAMVNNDTQPDKSTELTRFQKFRQHGGHIIGLPVNSTELNQKSVLFKKELDAKPVH